MVERPSLLPRHYHQSPEPNRWLPFSTWQLQTYPSLRSLLELFEISFPRPVLLFLIHIPEVIYLLDYRICRLWERFKSQQFSRNNFIESLRKFNFYLSVEVGSELGFSAVGARAHNVSQGALTLNVGQFSEGLWPLIDEYLFTVHHDNLMNFQF